MEFDAYETWLGIPADQRPPTHYQLLGLAPYESDPAAIGQAALRRMSKVRQYQLGPHSDRAEEVLHELARARLILMDPDRRTDYDAKLQARGGSRQIRSLAAELRRNDDASGQPPGHHEDTRTPSPRSLLPSTQAAARLACDRPRTKRPPGRREGSSSGSNWRPMRRSSEPSSTSSSPPGSRTKTLPISFPAIRLPRPFPRSSHAHSPPSSRSRRNRKHRMRISRGDRPVPPMEPAMQASSRPTC